MASLQGTMMPFLYPSLLAARKTSACSFWTISKRSRPLGVTSRCAQHAQFRISTRRRRPQLSEGDLPPLPDVTTQRSLNPTPDDFSSSLFADTATITIQAGSGGNGCVSFLREKYISAGPANGGDGGTGGNVYIAAVPELKSLHKLARRREIKAGNGRHGMGKSRGGQRGDDVVLEVPVGTVVREIERWDPVEEAEREYEAEEQRQCMEKRDALREEKRRRYEALSTGTRELEHGEGEGTRGSVGSMHARSAWLEEEETEAGGQEDLERQGPGKNNNNNNNSSSSSSSSRRRIRQSDDDRHGRTRPDMIGFGADAVHERDDDGNVQHKRPVIDGDQRGRWRRDRWLLQPSSLPSDYATTDFPALPRPRRSNVAALQPAAPITMDLSQATPTPVLLAAGAVGGLGNPHFATKSIVRPKFATKGNVGMKIKLQLELKLLADLGFVGMPNAGKSTLLRALSNSRARVGSWAFTTLVPNLGTVVLDDNTGRARFEARDGDGRRLSGITVADIPGLVVGASRDRGLGLDFLRHVERAKVLAFVVDLSAGDAVRALKGLWSELDAYEKNRKKVEQEKSQGVISWGTVGTPLESADGEDGSLVAAAAQPVIWKAGLQDDGRQPASTAPPSISRKPWFVVATKADVEDTQDNFNALQAYLADVAAGRAEHPAGQETGQVHRWMTARLVAVPVSAIHGQGIEKIVRCTADLLSG